MLQTFRDHKLATILGFIFGTISPIFGLFLGLQVAPILGTIFAFPFIVSGWLSGTSILGAPPFVKVTSVLVSGVVWSFIFSRIAKWRRP